MCVTSSPSPDQSDSRKPTTGNRIFSIPTHPGRPKEYNIDEPAPLNVRKVLKAQNTTSLPPAAPAPKGKSPIEIAVQEFEKSAAEGEESAEIEAEVARLDRRIAAAWAYVADKSSKKMTSAMVPIDAPATGRNREKTIAKLEGREYISPLEVAAAEETVIPGYLEGAQVEHRTTFEDINEEIDDMLKKAAKRQKKRKGILKEDA
ncbi:hypothetical protein BGX38DRAFT_1205018 [Terfezia claveryi]|nr:hypothetical protein BGX38DRAFT_1205018 [Terfezia claveryi]